MHTIWSKQPNWVYWPHKLMVAMEPDRKRQQVYELAFDKARRTYGDYRDIQSLSLLLGVQIDGANHIHRISQAVRNAHFEGQRRSEEDISSWIYRISQGTFALEAAYELIWEMILSNPMNNFSTSEKSIAAFGLGCIFGEAAARGRINHHLGGIL